MAYADLTSDQKAQVQAFMDAYRPVMGETARLFAKLARLEDAWAGGVSAIFAALADADVIGTATGMAGAGVLTKANVVGTMGDFASALVGFYGDTNRQRYIQAAGLPNVI